MISINLAKMPVRDQRSQVELFTDTKKSPGFEYL